MQLDGPRGGAASWAIPRTPETKVRMTKREQLAGNRYRLLRDSESTTSRDGRDRGDSSSTRGRQGHQGEQDDPAASRALPGP